MTPVLSAQQISKYYGSRLAVDKVSFDVAHGEVVGLLGPNGSGKSTILRILTGYLHPSSGTALVGGYDVLTHGIEARRRIGYVPEDVPLYPHMRVSEFLAFMGTVRGLSQAALPAAMDSVIARLSLGSVRSLPIAKLSRGYRQRVAIAQALLGNPDLLVLDEPTNGLDPRQIIDVRELIRALSRDMAVLVTSHILAEIERVAHRVAILLHGKLLTVRTLSDIEAAPMTFLRLSGTDEATARRVLATVGELIEVCPPRGEYTLRGEVAPAVAALARAGIAVEEATPVRNNLEELFLRLTREPNA